MKEKLKAILRNAWNEPRHFFVWLTLFSGAGVDFGFSLAVGYPSSYPYPPPPWWQPTYGMIGMACFGAGAVVGIIGFILSWIPPVRLLLAGMLRWRFFLLACLATLVALFYTEEDLRGKWAWEKFEREGEAKGEKFDLVSLAPPPVPDAQNLALAPLLKPLFDYARTTNGVRWLDTNGYARLEAIQADLPPYRETNNGLRLGSLENGTLADLEACRSFYSGNTNYPQPVRAGTAAEDILVALGKFDTAINELRQAADARPYCRFPVEYDHEMPEGILLPHLIVMKRLGILLEMRATALLEPGRSREAFGDLKLGFRFADSIRDEPILISHLVRLAMLRFDLQTLREGLVRHAWSDAQLAELEKYLASVDLLAEYEHAMRGERAFQMGMADWARRQGFKFNLGDFFGGDFHESPIPGHGPLLARVFNLMPSGWYYQNMLIMARFHQSFTLAAVDEQKHRVFPDISDSQDRKVMDEEMRRTPFNILARELIPALSRTSERTARGQTYVDAARIACALERFRLANSQWPDTLDALVPRFTDRIPTDVIDGQPLRYRKTTDGGYVVYSIGWNKTDDGGVVGMTKSGSLDVEKGDWVWKYPAK